MRIVTATDASRSFAALLDEAERGGTIRRNPGRRRIATIGPAPAGNGSAVLALLQKAELDEEFAADVRAARESVGADASSGCED